MGTERHQNIQIFLRSFMIALSNARMYAFNHPQTERMLAAAIAALRTSFDQKPQIELLLLDDHVVVDASRLPHSLYAERFAREFLEHGCSHITIRSSITDAELLALMQMLLLERDLRPDFASADFGTIDFGTGKESPTANDTDVLLPLLEDLPQAELDQFRDIYDAMKQGKQFHVSGLYRVVRGLIETFRDEGHVLSALAPLRVLDEYTFTHAMNVCVLNLAQATSLGIQGELLHDIGIAALLHDIGKLFVPEEILNKSSKLTTEEWKLMREHPVKGARYLMDNPGVPRLAVVTAFEHHLKYDLSGYPSVASSWQQNVCSHMTTISDYFDAMRTTRSYRQAQAKDMTGSQLLVLAGTQFHPFLAKNFARIMDTFDNRSKDTLAEETPFETEPKTGTVR
jgi:HD-GYP domain-containing protein (c-di-GMP phosphodiesterase class II)